MKLVLPVLFLMLNTQGLLAQRPMDFAMTMQNPQMNDSIAMEEEFQIQMLISNQGDSLLQSSDTLQLYMTIFGDTAEFPYPDNLSLIITGQQMAPGSSIIVNFPMAFAVNVPGFGIEFCMGVVPINAGNPMLEQTPVDNTDCVTIYMIENTAGIDDSQMEQRNAFPNPASDNVFMSVIPDDNKVVLQSMDGRVALETILSGNKINCADLPDGSYVLHYQVNGTPVSERMVIRH